MALLNPYCSVAQVQAEIKQTGTLAATVQTQVEESINAASRFIDQYKGRDYYQHEFTALSPLKVYLASKCVAGDQLFLPYTPIIAATAITVKEGTTTLTENTDWIRFDDNFLRVGQSWEVYDTPEGCITITGKFGYSQTLSTAVPSGIPANITRACVLIASNLSGQNSIDMVSAEGERQSIIQKNIPKEALTLLGHRRIFL